MSPDRYRERPVASASARTRIRREPQWAAYDRETINAVLDAALVAHLGVVDGGQPLVIPTLHARAGDQIYVHGSAVSRTLRVLQAARQVCVTVTLLDGLVLARSVFEHSVNYRSVVVLGQARLIDEPEEKLAALRALTEQLLPGRWADARPPAPQELKATSILALPLTEASAKIRVGPPQDAGTDGHLPVWAGEVPFHTVTGLPRPDPALKPGVPVPDYVRSYERPGLISWPQEPHREWP